MKKKKNKEGQNPLHREYSLLSNMAYVVRAALDRSKIFILMLIVGIICTPVLRYFWSVISKLIIDLITVGSTKSLFRLMLWAVLIWLAASVGNIWIKGMWFQYQGVRLNLIHLKNLKVMKMDYCRLEDPDTLDCFEKAGNACGSNTNGVEGMIRFTMQLIYNLALTALGLIIMGSFNPVAVLIMAAASVLQFASTNYTNKVSKKKVWDPLAPWWRKKNYMNYTLTDFGAAKDIRMFSLKDWLVSKYNELNRQRYEAQKTNQKLWYRNAWFNNILTAAANAVVYIWLITSVINGDISVGDFTLYFTSATTFYGCINLLLLEFSALLNCSREVDDFRSFMDMDGEENQGGVAVPKLPEYEFTFKNVSFKYPKAENYALKDINITLKAGKRLAVVGLNGAGKSTFIKLLLRLYEPTQGEILLNGRNVKEYDKESYYKVFSAVFQDPHLFAFPLSENVSMKTPEDTNKEFAKECIINAGLGEKLSELEKGMDTEILKVLYDDGVDLSGGEKQKVALARALYKNAPVAVLDEPTAALDALAESKLYNDFDKLIGSKTAVYISHRLSSTRFCDAIALFKDGELAEYGTHESLMKKGGEYAKLFEVQSQYYKEKAVSEYA